MSDSIAAKVQEIAALPAGERPSAVTAILLSPEARSGEREALNRNAQLVTALRKANVWPYSDSPSSEGGKGI